MKQIIKTPTIKRYIISTVIIIIGLILFIGVEYYGRFHTERYNHSHYFDMYISVTTLIVIGIGDFILTYILRNTEVRN